MSSGAPADPGLPRRRERRRAAARRRAIVRRRRSAALGGVAAIALIAGVVVGAGGEEASERQAPEGAPSSACPAEIAADPLRLAGQMLIVRMEDDATGELIRSARRGEISGVILFPAEATEARELRPALRRLQRAAESGGNPPLFVMIDQEGGFVKRFAAAPPLRAPAQLAASGTRDDARLEGQATGNYLATDGINVDLAPVLDLGGEGSVMADRAFGSEAGRVTRLGLGFAAGLADEGVIAAPKHFPGLGPATVTTDAAPVTLDLTRRELRDDLAPFRRAVSAGAEMIMAGIAAYPAYGSDRPAALSPEVVDGLLRDELGFEGVVVTDDLEAPGVTGLGVAEGRAAVEAAAAGSDLLLHALGGGEEARRALVRAISRGRLDPGALERSCARVVALKRGALSQEETAAQTDDP